MPEEYRMQALGCCLSTSFVAILLLPFFFLSILLPHAGTKSWKTQSVTGVRSRDSHSSFPVTLPWGTSLTNLWRGKFFLKISTYNLTEIKPFHKLAKMFSSTERNETNYRKFFCFTDDLMFF